MSAADLLAEVEAWGGIFNIDYPRIIVDVPNEFPDAILKDLREHKDEIRAELVKRRYRPAFPGPNQRDDELAELVRSVEEEGYILLWSDVLQDMVAFHSNDFDLTSIPVLFVPYSDDEVRHLFAEDEPQLSSDDLRLIHAAKRTGAVITGSRSDDDDGKVLGNFQN